MQWRRFLRARSMTPQAFPRGTGPAAGRRSFAFVSTGHPSHHLNWRLLVRYLVPYRWQVLLLGGILAATIATQLATPLVASRFLDAAVGAGSIESLLGLAGFAMVLAILGQGIAVAETWVAEQISWGATNAPREDLAR